MDTQLITIEGPGPTNPIGTPKPPIDWTKPVQTKNGTPVRIIAIDHNLDLPVIGVVQGEGLLIVYREASKWSYCGRYGGMIGGSGCLDLMNVPDATPADTGAV